MAASSTTTPPPTNPSFLPRIMQSHRKPFPVVLLSLPFLLLALLFLFLLSHTTFSLLLCPLLPQPPAKPNATITTRLLDATVSKTSQIFHVSSTSTPPPTRPKKNQRLSKKRNTSLLRLLLRQSPRARRFAKRAAELFTSPCTRRFFMTWLSPLPQFGHRELLVVESLFRSHRNACLLIVSDTMDSAGGKKALRPFYKRGFRVAAASPDVPYLLTGTPAEEWLRKARRGDVAPGNVPLGQNLSNLLRLAVLYKYGGVYLDADVLILKPLTHLNNAIGAQAVDAATGEWTRLNNAVMVFDRAHPLLREFIAEFAATFDGSRWGHNGPYLVSRVVARLHRMPQIGVTVLPPQTFYPVDWTKIGGLFRAPKGRTEERWVRAKADSIRGKSLCVHLWNRESRGMEMEDGSVIGRLVSKTCLFCNFASSSAVQE